jgi:hypothetical protein
MHRRAIQRLKGRFVEPRPRAFYLRCSKESVKRGLFRLAECVLRRLPGPVPLSYREALSPAIYLLVILWYGERSSAGTTFRISIAQALESFLPQAVPAIDNFRREEKGYETAQSAVGTSGVARRVAGRLRRRGRRQRFATADTARADRNGQGIADDRSGARTTVNAHGCEHERKFVFHLGRRAIGVSAMQRHNHGITDPQYGLHDHGHWGRG